MGAGGGPLGPEDPATEDDEQGRQGRDHDDQGHDDADGQHRPEAGGGVHLGQRQAQQAEGHGRGAGDDRGSGPVQRDGHGLVPVVVLAQLLAVAGDQQQGVVGAGADHQHGQDERALPVDGQARVLGEEVDDGVGHREGHHRGEDGQDPHDRAAVGDQQDQHHDAEGDQQQVDVGPAEDLRLVGDQPAETGDVDRVLRSVGGDLAYLVGRLGHLEEGVAAVAHRHLDDRRLLVVGDARWHRLADHPADAADLGRLLLERGDVLGGEARGLLVDDGGGDRLGVAEVAEELEGAGRLGRPGEPRRGVVVLDVGELLEVAGRMRPRQPGRSRGRSTS